MSGRVRASALATAVGLLALAPAASAATTMSITSSSLALTNKLLVDVPVTDSCPALTGAFIVGAFANLSVEQAQSQAFAQATYQWRPLCDGAAHATDVSLVPSAGPSFHGAPALASASITDCGSDPSNPFVPICDNGTTGWQPVRLSG